MNASTRTLDLPPAGADALAASFATSHAGVVAFIAVAAEGSFAKAGERLGIGRSAVSRAVQRLEAQLDARLFSRTTRSTALTREGELFYTQCHPGVQRIVKAVQDMRALREDAPSGPLRVSAGTVFGRKVVAPLLAGFQDRYPAIAIDFLLSDGPVDFVADRIDVAFCDGDPADSEVVARRVAPMRLSLCASPAHVQRHGLPRSPADLAGHPCIHLRRASGRVHAWSFKVDGQPRSLSTEAVSTYNDADLVLQAVLAGRGIAQLADVQVQEALRDGRLLALLPEHAPDEQAHHLCYLSRRHMPARMRVFIDHMHERIQALDE